MAALQVPAQGGVVFGRVATGRLWARKAACIAVLEGVRVQVTLRAAGKGASRKGAGQGAQAQVPSNVPPQVASMTCVVAAGAAGWHRYSVVVVFVVYLSLPALRSEGEKGLCVARSAQVEPCTLAALAGVT